MSVNPAICVSCRGPGYINPAGSCLPYCDECRKKCGDCGYVKCRCIPFHSASAQRMDAQDDADERAYALNGCPDPEIVKFIKRTR